MAGNSKSTQTGKVPDAVRRAVERTIESTVGSGVQTRERAQDLVDDVLRRAEQGAQRAREVTDKQREAASGVGERFVSAIQDLRLATGDDVRQLHKKIDRLDRRIAKLEGGSTTKKSPKKKPAAMTKKSKARKKTAKRKPKRKS